MYSNLVSLTMSLMHGWIVGIFVRDKVGRFDVAAVRIFPFAVEDLCIEVDIVVVDGVIEGDSDHLWHVTSGQVSGDHGAVLRAETVRQNALRGVAVWGSVRVIVDIYNKKTTLPTFITFIKMFRIHQIILRHSINLSEQDS